MSRLLTRIERELRAEMVQELSDGRPWGSAPTGLMQQAADEIQRLERALLARVKGPRKYPLCNQCGQTRFARIHRNPLSTTTHDYAPTHRSQRGSMRSPAKRKR